MVKKNSGPKKIWSKISLINKELVKKEFGPKIFWLKKGFDRKNNISKKSKKSLVREEGGLAGWLVRERGE